ncbi:wsc domain-containing protein [Pyrenophora teres f. maculata]|nr:wsc domain-containing protein [Pyrenophora teres f. maculata]
MKSVASFAAAAAVLSASADAFWRMPCRARTGLARLDPIVDFGLASSHSHTIHGGSKFCESSTYDMLRESDCTSCQFSDDKSAYWTPSLHFVHENGKTEVVPQVGGMLAYYLLLGDDIKAFPKGFEVIAGDSRLRNFTGPVPDPPTSSWGPEDTTQLALGQKALGFNCLNYDMPPEGSRFRHTMPSKEYMDAHCKNGIRAEIFFPSCWNGKDVDSPDHKSHMAYPDLIQGGKCPKGFEVRLPSLFYETIWDTYKFQGQPGQFLWSNGDPTGCGYHADFMNGWDIDTLQQAVNTCTNPSGRVEDCPVFSASLQSELKQNMCKIEEMPKILEDDDCAGPSEGLCGNVPIQYGPAYADPVGHPNPGKPNKPVLSSVEMPTQSYAPARSTGAGGISVYNVDVDVNVGVNAAPTTSSSSSSSPTPAAPPAAITPVADPDADEDGSIISTSTYVKDGVVYEVVIKEVITYVTVNSKRRRHAHKHRREHGVLGRH